MTKTLMSYMHEKRLNREVFHEVCVEERIISKSLREIKRQCATKLINPSIIKIQKNDYNSRFYVSVYVLSQMGP